MLTQADQKKLNDSIDTRLAVDTLRAVFTENGNIRPKHQAALDALARFCKIGATDYKTDQVEINRMVGRHEVFNHIMFCLKYPKEESRKLAEQITRLEDTKDGRRSDADRD